MTDRRNWKGTISHRRKAVAESDNTDTEYEKDNLLQNPVCSSDQTMFCSNCCNCRIEKNKTKQNLLSSRCDIKVPYKSTSYREEGDVEEPLMDKTKLEMKVLNDELNEQEFYDKQAENKQKMEDVTEMLRTLSIYAHTLDMRHKVSLRLLQLVDKLVPTKHLHRPVKESASWSSINKKLQDMVNSVSDHCELPESYVEVLDEYRDKHKDFTKATSNFCRILQNGTNVSNTQLRKLELQYDEIRGNYCSSKTAFSTQLEELLDARIEVADRYLQNLSPLLSQTVDCDKELMSIMKEIPPVRDLIQPVPRRVSSVRSLPDKIQTKSQTSETSPKLDGSGDRCTCGKNVNCS